MSEIPRPRRNAQCAAGIDAFDVVPGITGHSEFQDVGFPSSDVYLWYQSPTVPLCARLRVCNSLQVSLHSNSATASLKVPSVADSRERHAHGMAMRWNRNQRKTSRRVVFGLRIKRLLSEYRASQELSSSKSLCKGWLTFAAYDN